MIKTPSIKKDLIITLSSLFAMILIIVLLAEFFYTKHHRQEEFDANLVKSAKLIFGLIEHEVAEEKDVKFLENVTPSLEQKIFNRYEYKIHAQAWSDNYLVYTSDKNLIVDKPNYEGFKDIVMSNGHWRSFSFYDPESKIRILVVEKDFIKNKLVLEILLLFIAPLLLSFALLLLIIILTVNKKLKPLEQITSEIEAMSVQTLEEFKNPNIPVELKPFIESFNSLVHRLIESIETEHNFTNYAAHELRTPLAAISVQAHLLANNTNPELNTEYSQNLFDGISRATHLINQLLILSRIESDNNVIEKEMFNLQELTKSTIKNYQKKIEEKNLEVKFDCATENQKTIIAGNKTYIEIMIGNIVDNAIKYSAKDSKVFVLISEKNNSLSLKISNFGEQIVPEEIDKIFNNFYRINRLETTNNNTGCGLGLAISKKIASLYSAVISFESQDGVNSVEVIFNKTNSQDS